MNNLNKWLTYIITAGVFLLLWTPLVLSRSLFFPYISGKAFFFRIIVEIVFALWLFLAWQEPTYRIKRSWIFSALLGLVTVSALATIFGQDPAHSFWSNFERMDGLISYLHLSFYFIVITSIFRTEKIWQWFFHASLGISLIVIGYSLAQVGGALPITQGRLDATFGNAIYLAVYLVFHAFLALFLMLKHWRQFWLRFVYGVLILLQLFVVYKTATRGAMLGLIAGVFITVLILLIKKWSEPKIRRIALGVLVALVLVVGGFWFARDSNFVKNSPILSRFADISTTDATTNARLIIWQMSLRGFREHPLLGWGPENYSLVFNKYYQPQLWDYEQWYDRSHNIFLDWLIDAGVLGLLAYLFLFVATFLCLWRSRQTLVIKGLFTGLLVAYLVNNIFAFDNLTSYLVFLSFLAYLHYHSLATSPEAIPNKSKHLLTWDASHTAMAILLAVVLSSSLYYFNFRPLTAGVTLIRAINSAPANSQPEIVLKTRLTLFKQIFAANTLLTHEASEQLFNQVISVKNNPNISNELKQEAVTLTITEMKRQAERTPQDARTQLLLGTALDAFGQSQEAVSVLRKASDLSPDKQTILFQLAGAYLNAGDRGAMLETARRAFDLDRRFPEARRFYALALLYAGDLRASDQILAEDKNVELDERFINAYVQLKRYDLVLKLWQDKTKKNPGDIQSHFSLAAAYLTMGQRENAIKELEAAAGVNQEVKAQTDYLIKEIRAGRNPVNQ